MDQLRKVILESAQLAQRHTSRLEQANYEFSQEEMNCVSQLRESAEYRVAIERNRGVDRHTLREAFVQCTSAPISVIDLLSHKLSALMESGELGVDLAFPTALTEKIETVSDGIRVNEQTLYEGMGSSTSDDHEGMGDHGMMGVGDGGDKNEPKGDIDSGTSQKSDHGDHGQTASKGYMDESEDDDEDDDMEEGKEPPKDAPLSTKPTAADDADMADKVTHQKENAHSKADGGPKMDHTPKASEPGTGSATVSKDQPEAPGEVPSNHPDYEKSKKDGHGGDLDKGPASPVNEASVEAQIVEMLAEHGITPDHDEFTEAFTTAFSYYISERADALIEAKKCENDDEDEDDDMEEGKMPDFMKKDDDDEDDSDD